MSGNCEHLILQRTLARCVHDTFMHRYKLVNGVATVCMRATYLHRVDVGECPGGRVFNGRFGASCCKAAHVQAGADVAVLHLQMYAHMEVEAPGLCPTPLSPAIGNASDACQQGLASSPCFKLTRNGAGRGGSWAETS